MPGKKKFGKQLSQGSNVKSTIAFPRHITHDHALKQRKLDNLRWMVPVILAVTFVAFIPVLGAGFINWDDGPYVLWNTAFKNADFKAILATPIQGNFHPLTMLSLYINYLVSGENAWSYHLLNLLIHLINCLLVLRLAMSLSKDNTIISFTTAILFGIHPVHVESVAWVSERKDVLYGMFFIAALITYTGYVDTKSRKQYLFTFLLFVLSLLSKPSAVIFPLAVLSVDFLRSRKINAKLLFEKIPFFVLSLAMGIVTLFAQRQSGAVGKLSIDTMHKILYSFYGVMMYIVKMVVPVNLCVFYPRPAANLNLPVEYYMAPFFFIALAFAFFYSLKRNRIVAFGILFYLVNLLLVLQFLTFGSAVIADRYTYIPYIGLLFIVGLIIDWLAKSNASKAWRIVFPITLVLSALTWQQSSAWQSSATLWDHAIRTQPSAMAYALRGIQFREEKQYDSAIEYLSRAIDLDPTDYAFYLSRGNTYFELKNPELAINDYRKVLLTKPDYPEVLNNMATQFAKLGLYDSAVKYATQAITIQPDLKPAYSNRALTFMKMKRYEDAIRDWEKFLRFDSNSAKVYNTIGNCYQAMGKYQESLVPIDKAISMIPDNPIFYISRSYSYNGLKNIEAAKKDALFAKQRGAQIPSDLAKSLGL